MASISNVQYFYTMFLYVYFRFGFVFTVSDSTEDINGVLTQHTTVQSTPYITVFNVSEVNHTWDRASDNCVDGWTLSGERMFNSCRSESCQTINANNILPNVKDKPPFLWLDGYVVRSPVMKYYECLEFRYVNRTAHLLTNTKKMNRNGVEKCSLFCQHDGNLTDKDIILLQKETCYCLPKKTFRQWRFQIDVIQMISTEDCDIQCVGDKFDRCGGRNYFFSAYKRMELPMSAEIDGNCFYTSGSSSQVLRTRCKEGLKFKCQEVVYRDGSRNIKVKCYELMLNWYDARQTCERSGGHIQLFNNKCDKNENFTADTLWHNTFVKERIIWNTNTVTGIEKNNGYSCLALMLTRDSKYILIAANCDNEYHSLCQKDVLGTDNVSKNTEQTTDDSKVSMYSGTAVALTILPITVVVLAVCIRRHRINVVVTEPAAISNSDDEYENVQENVNTDYHTLNLDLVGETNDYSTLQPNVPDYIEIH